MSKKKLFTSLIIYVINQDKKDAVCVPVILTLMRTSVHAVLQNSEQNHATNDYGNNYDLLWIVFLVGTAFGT